MCLPRTGSFHAMAFGRWSRLLYVWRLIVIKLATINQHHAQVTLGQHAHEVLARQLSQLHYNCWYQHPKDYMKTCQALVMPRLDTPIIQALHRLKDPDWALDSLLIDRLPVDAKIPATPTQAVRHRLADDTTIRENMQMALAGILGYPMGFVEEKQGQVIHDVCPKVNTQQPLSNEGHHPFDLHIENAFFTHRPQFLLLHGVRQDRERKAATRVCHAALALMQVSQEHKHWLRQPLYRIRRPYSLDSVQGLPLYCHPTAILSGSEQRPQLRLTCYQGGTMTDHPQASRALKALMAALTQHSQAILLAPGQTLIINNDTVLHGRSGYFVPRGDGRDRYLMRIYIMHERCQHLCTRPYQSSYRVMV